MSKLTKKAEIIDKLHALAAKHAEAQDSVKGKPGADTNVMKTPDATEAVDKNGVGADKLDGKQKFDQKASESVHAPAKTASELAEEVLGEINKLAEAQDTVKGTPGADTNLMKTPDATETVDKNGVGADKQNGKQKFEQKGSESSHAPAKTASEIEEVAKKIASYEIGKSFMIALAKQASATPQVNTQAELLKEAGRRDFDLIVSQAAAALENKKASEQQEEFQKQAAEQQGAQYFDEMLKQAQIKLVVDENVQLKQKLAAYEEHYAAVQQEFNKTAAVQHEADLVNRISKQAAESAAQAVIAALKNEPVTAASK